jgi:uncharacterized membrane protein
MIDDAPFVLTLITAVACGLNAGVFFAFSSFVMQGLGRLPAAQGLAAMQAINVTAVTFAFMFALFGTAVLCLVLVGWAIAEWGEPWAPYLLAGGALYVVGTILVTIVFHVPRNNALARLESTSAEAAPAWTRYLREWTAGNHVRTAAALAAAVVLTIALRVD